jgi:SH3 domain protein
VGKGLRSLVGVSTLCANLCQGELCMRRKGAIVRLAVVAIVMPLLLATTLWARTMYVSDIFEIVVRSEKNSETGRNIIKLLPTGTAVEVIDMDDSWATIRLPDGRTGYTLKRYLLTRLPYKLTAEKLQEEVEEQRQRLVTLTEQLTELQEEHRRLQDTSREQELQLTDVTTKYEQLRQDATGFLQLRADYTHLQQAHQQSQQQLNELQDSHLLLKKSRNLSWFLSGAGVMLAGWIIGMITERFRGRRKRQGGYSYQLPM